MHLTIHCDGGSRGNPGFGYGSYEIRNADTGQILVGVQKLPLGDDLTCNQAEYLILIRALEKATEFNPDVLTVWTDSMLVVNQVSGKWKHRKGGHLVPLKAQARNLLGALGGSIKWNSRKVSVEKFGH